MTKKKIGTVDPVAIRELISQGIPMERITKKGGSSFILSGAITGGEK